MSENQITGLTIKNGFEASREALLMDLRAGRLSGRAFARCLSEQKDNAIRKLAESHLRDFREKVALIAVGADGRQEATPASDTDLLLVVSDEIAGCLDRIDRIDKSLSEQGKETLETADQFLAHAEFENWQDREILEQALVFREAYIKFKRDLVDARFEVTIPSRSIAQCIEVATPKEKEESRDKWWEELSSMLDPRILWGDTALCAALDSDISKLWGQTAPDGQTYGKKFAARKMRERRERLDEAPPELLLREPNVKKGWGALRDAQTMPWLAAVAWDKKGFQELEDAGILLQGEAAEIEQAYDFLLKVRALLPTGGAKNLLTAEIQRDIAWYMINPGQENPEQADYAVVEAFMERYYTHTRKLAYFANIMEAMVEEEFLGKEPAFERTTDNEFEISETHIKFPKNGISGLGAIVGIFARAQKEERELHYSALRAIRAYMKNEAGVQDCEQAAAVVGAMLGNGLESGKILAQMQEIGVLQRIFPAFGTIDCQMQYDSFHAYTVGSHSIRCVGETEGILEDAEARLFNLSAADRKILKTAAFLHDIGKGELIKDYEKDNHPAQGAAIARQIAPQLGLNEQETEDVAWLVENHLLLVRLAMHRDPYDEWTIKAVSEKHGTIDQNEKTRRLNLLKLLTAADARAVSPECWSPEKAHAVNQLHRNVCDFVTAGTLNKRTRPELPSECDSGLETACVTATKDFNRNATWVNVAVKDHKHLFEHLTAAAVEMGLNIIKAEADTIEGFAYDRFLVQTHDGQSCQDEDKLKQVFARAAEKTGPVDQDELKKTAAGKIPLSVKKQKAYPVKPGVLATNEESETCTILQVTARQDWPGFLNRVSAIIADQGCAIRHLRTAEYGPKMVDSFYLTREKSGSSLEAKQLETLQRAVLRLLHEEDPAFEPQPA